MWATGRQVDGSILKAKVVEEFGAVRSAALKLGGRDIHNRAALLDSLRGRVLAIVEPVGWAGLTLDESQELRVAVEDLEQAAERATGRKRRVEWLLVATFLVGVVVGFLADVMIRVLGK